MRPHAVTPRQREILELRAQGLTTAEIAQRLWVSEMTVKGHLKAVNRALLARNSTHAVAIGLREGLIA